MGIADELSKIKDLHSQGILTDEEFAKAKHRILESDGISQASSVSESEEQGGLGAREHEPTVDVQPEPTTPKVEEQSPQRQATPPVSTRAPKQSRTGGDTRKNKYLPVLLLALLGVILIVVILNVGLNLDFGGDSSAKNYNSSVTSFDLPTPQGPQTVTMRVSVHVKQTKANGKKWDIGGGAPDPFVELRVFSSGRKLKSKIKKDTYNAGYVFHNVTLQPNDKISVKLTDADTSSHDPIGSWKLPYNGQYSLEGSGSAGSISITLE